MLPSLEPMSSCSSRAQEFGLLERLCNELVQLSHHRVQCSAISLDQCPYVRLLVLAAISEPQRPHEARLASDREPRGPTDSCGQARVVSRPRLEHRLDILAEDEKPVFPPQRPIRHSFDLRRSETHL